MSYGRILLVAALVFGGLYYYHTNELERQQKEHYNQLERERDAREAAKYEREEERERAEFKASLEAQVAQIERDYRRCFHRSPAKPFASMNNQEQLELITSLYPKQLGRAVCD